MIMTIHHNALVLRNNFNEGCELGVVFCCGDVWVMELQEFPGCVGVREMVGMDPMASTIPEVDYRIAAGLLPL